jgi:hypothetical protein
MIHLHGYIQNLEIWLPVDYGVRCGRWSKELPRKSRAVFDVEGSQAGEAADQAFEANLTDLSLDQCFESLADFPHPFSPQLYASIGTYAVKCDCPTATPAEGRDRFPSVLWTGRWKLARGCRASRSTSASSRSQTSRTRSAHNFTHRSEPTPNCAGSRSVRFGSVVAEGGARSSLASRGLFLT